MKNNKQPLGKTGLIIMWVVVAGIMVLAGAMDDEALIPAVLTMVLVTVIMLITTAAAKKNAAKGPAEPQNEVPEPPRRETQSVSDGPSQASRLRTKRGVWLFFFSMGVAGLTLLPVIFPWRQQRWVLRLFRLRGLVRGLKLLAEGDRASLVFVLVFAGLVLLCVIAVLRMIALTRRLAREPDNIPAARSARTAPPDTAAPIPAPDRDKYLRQLEAQYKAGLMDKEEYKLMRERYKRMR